MYSDQMSIDQPRWDQSTFRGRLYHFANLSDPRIAFVPKRDILASKELVELYLANKAPPNLKREHLLRAQKLYHSAIHPDTGEVQNAVGRMSFQVPGGTILIAAMITWYRSTTAVVFWQWANQSFNALVNYTNRNAKSDISPGNLIFAYFTATSAAVVTALGLKSALSKFGGTLIPRLIPLGAVYAAQCVNVPLMRQSELRDGLMLMDDKSVDRGKSRLAALKAISLVVFSRNVIATPPMLLTPIFMVKLEKMGWYLKNERFLSMPLQLFFSASLLALSVPVGCALFPQRNHISTQTLKKHEPEAYQKLKSTSPLPEYLYFNKGL